MEDWLTETGGWCQDCALEVCCCDLLKLEEKIKVIGKHEGWYDQMKEEGRLEEEDEEGCSQGPDQAESPGLGNITFNVRAYQEIPQLGP